jgi:hypothetical protein
VRPVISADGSTIAFASFDNNLVTNEVIPPQQENQASHPGPVIEFIYLYDVKTQTVTLVNHATGQPATVNAPTANGVFYDSFQPAISADGKFVAFAFGEPDDDGVGVALYNRTADKTTAIVAGPDTMAVVPRDPTISDNGQFVSYLDRGQVHVYDGATGKSVLASHDNSSPTSTKPANGVFSAPVISHDGSAVAFVSTSTNLVPGQVASAFTNVFLYRNDTSGHDAVGPVRLVSGALNGTISSATTGGNGNSDSPAIDLKGDYVAYRSDATNLVPGQSGPKGNVFEFNAQADTQTLVSHDNTSLTSATGVGGSSSPVIDDDGHLVSYASTAGNLIPGQMRPTGAPAGLDNVYIWLRQTNANILASGENGSPIMTGNADSDIPLLTRGSFPGFSSRATNLVNGIGGTSVAYINTLVALALSTNTVAVGSPSGTVVGTLSVSSLLRGQFLPPVYSLPGGEASNRLFGVSGATLVIEVMPAGAQGYQVSVHVNIGFGDDAVVLNVFAAVPAPGGGFVGGPGGGGADPLGAELVSVRVGKHRTARLMVEVIDLVTGAEVEAFVSPFQAPAYRAITLTPLGNGLFRLSSRKDKHTVSILLAF